MRLTDLQKLLASVAAVHVAAVVGVAIWWDPSWFALSLAALVAFLWFGHDLYHHRYLSHRSFEMSKGWQRACSVLGVYCLFGTPIGIAATHVRHHRFADTDDDPHPAAHPLQSWFWTYGGMKVRDRATVVRLSKDAWLRFISKYYFKIYFGTVVAAAAIDPRIAVYGFAVPAVYAFFSNGLVNVICHRWGGVRFRTQDNSRNNHWINALLFFSGIAMHNNHHARPKDFSMSHAWYEIDLVGAVAGHLNQRHEERS